MYVLASPIERDCVCVCIFICVYVYVLCRYCTGVCTSAFILLVMIFVLLCTPGQLSRELPGILLSFAFHFVPGAGTADSHHQHQAGDPH